MSAPGFARGLPHTKIRGWLGRKRFWPGSFRRQAHQIDEWPGDVMSALATLTHPADVDDVEYRERIRRKTVVVYGQDEAARRHAARSAFLASLASDPERREEIADRTERARRRVRGET